MYFNLIFFKGADKTLSIRTEKPIDFNELLVDSLVEIKDDSTGEVSQFRPEDVLRINYLEEEKVNIKTEITGRSESKKKPKGFEIN